MAFISKKKDIYPVSSELLKYLSKYGRSKELPISYENLHRYDNAIPLYDRNNNDTLWQTVFYAQNDMHEVYAALKLIYSLMKTSGAMEVLEHLYIDRVDLCAYGNTQPFRVRVVNQINDNFDYFYIKHADASRLYGLELEHLLSPNKLSFIIHNQTLIEEHIVGMPGEQFITRYLDDPHLNKIRLAKEFVKFNERCFVRLLGDMHSNNFVIDITPDFEEVDYRLRAIDFDQQSYEGRLAIYQPKFYKQNNPIINLGIATMNKATLRQYQKEERTLIANRIKVDNRRINYLMSVMQKEQLSKQEYVRKLANELADFYEERAFLTSKTMGDLVNISLSMLFKKPDLYKEIAQYK